MLPIIFSRAIPPLVRKLNGIGRHFCTLAAIALMSCELGAATAPEVVLIGKLGLHRQISGTTVNPIASAFAVDVYIASPVPPSIQVRLKKPSGETIPLEQGALDRFSHYEYFFNEAELATAYPQGTYTIVVTEGGADTATAC